MWSHNKNIIWLYPLLIKAECLLYPNSFFYLYKWTIIICKLFLVFHTQSGMTEIYSSLLSMQRSCTVQLICNKTLTDREALMPRITFVISPDLKSAYLLVYCWRNMQPFHATKTWHLEIQRRGHWWCAGWMWACLAGCPRPLAGLD